MSRKGISRFAQIAIAAIAIAVWLPAQTALGQCSPPNPCVTAPTDLGNGEASAVSDDGMVVVGTTDVLGASHAFRWTAAGGMMDLGTLGGNSDAFGISGDGSTIVGVSNTHAFRWTASTGMADLSTLGGGASGANGVNSDGSVVVGLSEITGSLTTHAFRWTASTGMIDLGTLGGTSSVASAVNGNGSVVVGTSDISANRASHAFRWTTTGGMNDLGTLGSGSFATAVTADGSIVTGWSRLLNNDSHVFRWIAATGMTDLGTLPGGFDAQAVGISGDGSVIVGWSGTTGPNGPGTGGAHAFRWTAATGMQDLNFLLLNAGVNMSGIFLAYANAISANGQYIVGQGDFPGSPFHAFLVRYYDGTPAGPIAGLTTFESLQNSVNDLANERAGAMAQEHGLALPLLGDDKPIGSGSEAGVFGYGGSAAGGGFTRLGSSYGLALLAGVSYGQEAYGRAEIDDSFLGAVAVRYLEPGHGLWHPFAEVGGWLAPNGRLEFDRTYMNGAGTATGVGNTKGDLSYLFGRAGVALNLGRRDQIVLSGELGRERLEVNGYSEQLTAANPFNASVTSGTDRMDLAKARLAWSFAMTRAFEATLWGAAVCGFNNEDNLVANVAGVGTFTAITDRQLAWAEYGARVGYALSNAMTFDVFAEGVSGQRDEIGTRVHGGAGLRFAF